MNESPEQTGSTERHRFRPGGRNYMEFTIARGIRARDVDQSVIRAAIDPPDDCVTRDSLFNESAGWKLKTKKLAFRNMTVRVSSNFPMLKN